MDYFKKIERSVTISADKRSTVDLQVDVWSQDLNVTKFILKLDTTDSTAIDLTNANVRVAMVYSQDGTDVKIEAAGIVEDVATQKIAYIMDNRLAGFEGQVTAGFYVTLSTGQRIDIQNVTFNTRKSLLDKDLEPAKKSYYQTFDDIVADVQLTGNVAKTQIGQVLPDVQSKVAAINTELAKIDENMPDLFVAYADDSSGGGFSKTDNTKLYKGYGVKNSNLPADYRWESNIDNLQIGGRNLIVNSEKYTKENPWNRSISGVDDYTITDMYFPVVKNRKYTFQFCTNRPIGYHQTDSTAKGTTHIMLFLQTQDMVGTANSGWIIDLDINTLQTRNGKYYQTFTIPNNYDYVRAVVRIDGHADGNQYDLKYWNLQAEEGTKDSTWQPPIETLSQPVNSILTTLSAENPSTTLGGAWVQLGNETKFDNTIYYWKRTQ